MTGLPVVVWVRGPAEIDADAHTTRDRATAWHLSRGGCPTIALDVSPADVAGLDADTIRMRVVRAVYADDGDTDWREVDDRSFPRPTVRDPERVNVAGRPGAFVLDVAAVEAELRHLVTELAGDRDGTVGDVGVGAVRDAAQALRDAQAGRDAAIVETVEAGVPIARVADAAGLSRQAVYSIAQGWTRPDRRG